MVLHAGLTASNHMWAAAAFVMVVLIAMVVPVYRWRRSLTTQAAGIHLAVHSTLTMMRQPSPCSTPALWSELLNLDVLLGLIWSMEGVRPISCQHAMVVYAYLSHAL